MLRAIRTIDYIIILCQDIERMKRFYQEVLGFPLSSEGNEWIDFHVGATRLALRKRGNRRSLLSAFPANAFFDTFLALVSRCVSWENKSRAGKTACS
jgi:catechol 2,3-dioxygenase-like lactoylglutathione lyase family enzyme